MFLFDMLFGRKAPVASVAPKPAAPVKDTAGRAPGTAINHDPQLIEHLQDEHRKMLDLFGSIIGASQSGQLSEAQDLLERFRTAIMDHLLKENVRLYIYLEHVLVDDPIAHDLMHGFRREMDAIGRVVVEFLGKYKSIGSRPDLAGAFAADLAGIGGALAARIHREEETLYPMYQPPAH